MATLRLTKVVRNIDIFQLPVNAEFSFDRDAKGHLWFARSVRSPTDAFLGSRTKKPPRGAEVTEAADPEQNDHWAQDFADDSPRVFDAVHDHDDDD